MPFINDRLAEESEARQKAAAINETIRQSRFTFDPQQAAELIRKNILGQSDALNAVEDILYQVKADIGVAHRPLSVNLLVGPTGVGKTETAKLIAQAITGSAKNLCRIDMNTLSQSHYAAAISGAPPGYAGSKEGHTLLDEALIKGSFSAPSVVLFDELEKASREVIRALLNILDSGKLVLASGQQTFDFTNSIVLMTSNLVGDYSPLAKLVRRLGGTESTAQSQKRIDRVLRKHLDMEFINRIDRVIYYSTIDSKFTEQLCRLALDRLCARLARRTVVLSYSAETVALLCESYQKDYGARSVERIIRSQIEPLVAKVMLNHERCERFSCEVNHGEIVLVPEVTAD